MRHMRTLAICMLVAATFTAGPAAQADHCNGDVTSIGDTIYVDDRGLESGDVWFYLESNGEAGLQSGGANPTGDYVDGCAHDNPDTLLY